MEKADDILINIRERYKFRLVNDYLLNIIKNMRTVWGIVPPTAQNPIWKKNFGSAEVYLQIYSDMRTAVIALNTEVNSRKTETNLQNKT